MERARQELVIIYNFPLGRLPGFPSTLLFPRFERIALFHRAAFLLVHLRGDEETNRRRRKEARKKEGSEKRRNERERKKNGRPRGPVRPRKWKRRREMAVSIIPETMTDRHRYSGWKPSRIRDKDGDTLTPGINLSKDEAAVSVVNSGIPTSFAYIYIYALLRAGNDACWSTDSMDGDREMARLACAIAAPPPLT